MAEYIEREAAIKAIYDSDPNGIRRTLGFNVGQIEEALRAIPTADVAPVRHGAWISWDEADNFIPSPHRHECSVCHDAAQVLVNGVELLSDYCPNCGAKMDGAE